LLGVETVRRFVEHQQLWSAEQGLGQPDPASLPPGQRADALGPSVAQVHLLEDPSHLRPPRSRLVPFHEDGHVVEEPVGGEATRIAELLRQVAEPPADVGALGADSGVATQDAH
jgi:hypothetical protein